ncbi:SWI/SNF complex subunit SWI3A, partial [Linum perenne]
PGPKWRQQPARTLVWSRPDPANQSSISTPFPAPPVSFFLHSISFYLHKYSPGEAIPFFFFYSPAPLGWFRWNDIHETERASLREFYDGSSITRSPKIYKEYRDFMINRYREDPSRRLTFTEVRKSLVGDVSLLQKVFQFLNDWGLINFGAESAQIELDKEDKDGVRFEDGPPNGVRVVATPNSLRPISVPHTGAPRHIDGGGNRSKLPPLASYSDVFGELGRQKGTLCRCCGGTCESTRYEYDKEDNHTICVKCFKDGKYGNDSADNFKLRECSDNGTEQSDLWTEAETLLLLESVLKHGDDWDLVAQSVRTKTKLECISKLIELPFGEFISTSSLERENARGLHVTVDSGKEVPLFLTGQQDVVKRDELSPVLPKVNDQNGYNADNDPPLKKQRVSSPSGSGISVMKQVAHISSMVRADITAAAAQAAFAALCDEASCPKERLDDEENFVNRLWPQTGHSESERMHHQDEDIEVEGGPAHSEARETNFCQNDVPLTLRLRATVAAALGAAAAHGKLLADEEDQQIEALVGIITETQLKKLQCKMKDLDDMEVIMEREHAELEEVKRSLTEQRIDMIGKGGIRAGGTSKLRDDSSVKSENANVL